MVTIVDFVKRKNSEGEEFNALILQGGIELVKSRETGRYYATAKKTSITSTFDDAMCQSLIGTQIPGSVQHSAGLRMAILICGRCTISLPVVQKAHTLILFLTGIQGH